MEQYQSVTSHIISSVHTLESLVKDTHDVETGNAQMLAELADLRLKISEYSECKTELSGRSRAMREKIQHSGEDIKKESGEVKCAIKRYFKCLGVKVEQEPINESENYIEVRISLKEANVSFSLAYDLVSDDFERELGRM